MRIERSTGMGLRERKKLATRQALSVAALRLAVQRGLEHVRVEDIAAEAGVSPRTFNNYFSSKEEAIVSLGVDRAARIAAGLRDRPASEPLPDALSREFVEQYGGDAEPDREWVARLRVVISSPALRGEYLKTLASTERLLAEAIAERTGTDVERDLFPRVLAAAASGAARTALMYWLELGAATTFAPVLQQAIEQVVLGAPPPTADIGSST